MKKNAKEWFWFVVRAVAYGIFARQVFIETGFFTTLVLSVLYAVTEYDLQIQIDIRNRLDGLSDKIKEWNKTSVEQNKQILAEVDKMINGLKKMLHIK